MNTNNVNDRLSQASQGGSPQVDPDQQRRYLGTFRERVSLAVPVQDMSDRLAQQAFIKDIQATHSKYIAFINDNFSNDIVGIYMAICTHHHVKFILKSDSNYANEQLSYGLVYTTAHTPINVKNVLWTNKYPYIKRKSNCKHFILDKADSDELHSVKSWIEKRQKMLE